ncbi:MAG TPA: hypothetical protein DDZ41_03945, partial [Flavobacterium sp.]|nr:hypothetical protein [Flavobacterium sp.]
MKTKRLVVLVISLLILGSCSSNDDNSVTENQPTLVHKWSLNGWKFNNVVQTLTNCKKQSYIQFNSNNTFERKDYAFVSNNCVLEGSDNGTYNYNSSTHKITLNFTDPNNGSQV